MKDTKIQAKNVTYSSLLYLLPMTTIEKLLNLKKKHLTKS